MRILILMIVLIMSATAAYAQFPDMGGFGGGFGGGGGPEPAAWSTFKLNKNVKVKLDFRNASPDAVFHVLSQASGIPIVKDPSLKDTISLESPKPLSLDDAFALLNTKLGLMNFELAKQGNFLVVRPTQGGFGSRNGGGGNNPFANGFPGEGRNQTELRVYSIKYADATQLAATVNAVFAATPGANVPAFGFAFGLTGPGNPNPPAVTPGGGGGRGGFGGPGGGFGGGRRGRGGFGAGGAGNFGQSTDQNVKASADAYSNSLIVNAPSSIQSQIRTLIDEIDKPSTQPMQTQVFKLDYALATDIEPIVQNILSSSQPLGRGGSTSQTNNRPGGGFGGGGPGAFFRAAFGGNNQNSYGTVSAYTNTNSLVVTSIQSNLDEVKAVIAQLDKPVKYQSTTFLYVLKNARADVVANLFNQAVGNRTTGNTENGGSLTNTGPTQTAISTTTAVGTPGAGTGTSSSPGGLSTNTFGGGGGGGYRGGGGGFGGNNSYGGSTSNSGQNMSTNSLDAAGHVVSVLNLYGQVLLIPNIDTNSVIVVAPPQLQPQVKSILDQMDSIPEQVMIETLVVEVSLEKKDQFGVEWSFLNNKPFGIHNATGSGSSSFGLQSTTTQPQGLRYTLTAPEFQAFVNAISTDTKFNVLSTPRIFTTNNATSQINISQSIPYVTSQLTDATGSVTSSYNFLNVGIVLTVTPRITQGGYVTMDVSQTADDFVSFTSFNAPITNQREAQTTVSVMDGNTVVLGGIISNQINKTVNKVPILGDIPLIGQLFRSTSNDNQKTELLVFLTPHVVKNPQDAQQLRVDTESDLGKSTQQMIPKPATPAAPNGSTTQGSGLDPATPSTSNSTDSTSTITTPPATITPPTTAPPATAAPTDNQPAQDNSPPATLSSTGPPDTTQASTPTGGSQVHPMTPAPGTSPVTNLPPPTPFKVTVSQ